MNIPLRWTAAVLLASAVGFPWTTALAQGNPSEEVVSTSPPSPVGAGARATAMGSAFIAVADDATAASWNPGGLTQLGKPELSVVGRFAYQEDSAPGFDTTSAGSPLRFGGASGSTSETDLNYLSAALPFSVADRNLVVSLNYQQQLSFDRELRFGSVEENELIGELALTRRFEQEGSIYSLSPALAAQVTRDLSFGVALNYWFDGIGASHAWKQRTRGRSVLNGEAGLSAVQTQHYEDFEGFNSTFGFLWRIGAGWSLGGVAESPVLADVERRLTIEVGDRLSPVARTRLDYDIPWNYGFGLSWRSPIDLRLSLDMSRVLWSDFRVRDGAGDERDAIGDPYDGSIDDTTTVRLGAEWSTPLESARLALRGGLFYDPEPARSSVADFYGTAAGIGFTTDHFSLDLAYQFRFANDLEGTATSIQVLKAPEAKLDLRQHYLYASLIYYL